MITKIGVSEFSAPAKELSTPSSAKQNKKAGNKLPRVPDKITSASLFLGISLKKRIALGSSTKPEATIRMAATWYAERPLSSPNFIKIKLLPQITASRENSNQFSRLLLFTAQSCRYLTTVPIHFYGTTVGKMNICRIFISYNHLTLNCI